MVGHIISHKPRSFMVSASAGQIVTVSATSVPVEIRGLI